MGDKSNLRAYYLNVIREVDEITGRTVVHNEGLPTDSIWNKYKLTSVHTLKTGRPASAVPDLGRELKRIEAAVACEMARMGHANSRHHPHIQQPTPLTPRERYVHTIYGQ